MVPIPVSISGLFGCPGYRKGGHVDVMLPTAAGRSKDSNYKYRSRYLTYCIYTLFDILHIHIEYTVVCIVYICILIM